jgi:CheY-like chemotaxis protein
MLKVLLVEDNDTMSILLKTLLEIEGYFVVIMHGVNEEELAQEIALSFPDAILLDVHLKKTNGINILRHLRKNPYTNQTPILMTSGLNLRDECLQAGANFFLMKPFMPDDLIRWLNKMLL